MPLDEVDAALARLDAQKAINAALFFTISMMHVRKEQADSTFLDNDGIREYKTDPII